MRQLLPAPPALHTDPSPLARHGPAVLLMLPMAWLGMLLMEHWQHTLTQRAGAMGLELATTGAVPDSVVSLCCALIPLLVVRLTGPWLPDQQVLALIIVLGCSTLSLFTGLLVLLGAGPDPLQLAPILTYPSWYPVLSFSIGMNTGLILLLVIQRAPALRTVS